MLEWYKLPIADPAAYQMLVKHLLRDKPFPNQTMNLESGPRTSRFTVEEILECVHAYFFARARSLSSKPYTLDYFNSLHSPTVLLVFTALRYSLMEYEDIRYKSLVVGDFSQTVFSGQ